MSRDIQKVFIAFLKIFKLWMPSFKSINSNALSRKKYLPPPQAITRSKHVSGNKVNLTYWDLWYIELKAIS